MLITPFSDSPTYFMYVHYVVFSKLSFEYMITALLIRKFMILPLISFISCYLCRLHSAGHLLDICLPKIGLGHLEPGKAYHFSDGYIIYL